MSKVLIRPVAATDLAAVNAIYNHYIANTVVTFDIELYSLEQRQAWFERCSRAPYCAYVAEVGQQVLGYASAGEFRAKPAYATSVEVSVYLHPDATGRGLGAQLYRQLFATLQACDLHRAYALIALPNPGSIALHEQFGFKRLAVLSEVGRKFERYVDVAWYEKGL